MANGKAKAHEPAVGTWLDNVAWRWAGDTKLGLKVVERRSAEVMDYGETTGHRHVRLRSDNGEETIYVAATLVAAIHMGVVTVRPKAEP